MLVHAVGVLCCWIFCSLQSSCVPKILPSIHTQYHEQFPFDLKAIEKIWEDTARQLCFVFPHDMWFRLSVFYINCKFRALWMYSNVTLCFSPPLYISQCLPSFCACLLSAHWLSFTGGSCCKPLGKYIWKQQLTTRIAINYCVLFQRLPWILNSKDIITVCYKRDYNAQKRVKTPIDNPSACSENMF